jgi:hypothetical protein
LCRTVPQDQFRPKIIQNINVEILGKLIFSKILFLYNEKENLREFKKKIWHLQKEDLPKTNRHQGAEPNLGVW